MPSARSNLPAAAVVLLGAVAVALGPSHDSAQAGAQATERRVIATLRSNDIRVDVTARRDAAGEEPDTATVRIAAFQRSEGSWRRLGGPHRVGRPSAWFWNVVTSPFGVRRLQLDRPGGEFPERIALRLLISPSIGPSETFRFRTENGRLVPVAAR